MLKSSGRRYSSSSESHADAWQVEDVGEDDDSSKSRRWSSGPIFNFGTR